MRHVAPSSVLSSVLGRYLVALADSFAPVAAEPTAGQRRDPRTGTDGNTTKPTSARRKRLHLLYVVSDVLFHVTFRDPGAGQAFTASIELSLVPLVSSAASFVNAPKHLRKVSSLVDLWAEKQYFSDSVIAQLRAVVEEGPRVAKERQQKGRYQQSQSQGQTGRSAGGTQPPSSKELPFLLPAVHGDPATPWYDLPAANWLAVLEPNSTRPMNPSALKPLPMNPGPAPPALVASVRDLLVDVERMFGGPSSGSRAADQWDDADVDPLGERVEVDAFSGDILDGDTYYGWSRTFCRRMKERRQQGVQPSKAQDPSRNRNDSQETREKAPRPPSSAGSSASNASREHSRTRPHQQRHHDHDRSHGRADDGGMSRSRSRSPSQSHPVYKKRRTSASPSPRRYGTGHDHGRHRSQGHGSSRSSSASSRRWDTPLSRRDERGRGPNARSRSSDGSRSPHRRRRGYSPSSSRERSRGTERRSWSRSRSRSKSRSRSPRSAAARGHHGRHSQSPPPRDGRHAQHRSIQGPPAPALHSLPPIPPPPHPSFFPNAPGFAGAGSSSGQPAAVPPQFPPMRGLPPFPPPPFVSGTFPFVPPPPPPNYQGPWPPPLPMPQPPQMAPEPGLVGWGARPPPASSGDGGWAGGWQQGAAGVPPPPPPRQQQQRSQQRQNKDPSQRGGWGDRESWGSRGW